MNWKIFPTHGGIYKLEKIQQALWQSLERWIPKEFKEIWKDVSSRLILKDKGGKQHCSPFLPVLTWGLRYFCKKDGKSVKECVEIEDWRVSVQFWGFKKISCTLYTYVLVKILQNGARFI